MKIASAIVVFWLVCGIITAGTMNAHFRGNFPDLYQSPAYARQGFATSIGFGLLTGPLGLLISTFASGFWYHGWELTSKPFPCTKTNAHIWCK